MLDSSDWVCALCGAEHSFNDEGFFGPVISLCIGCGDHITERQYEELVKQVLMKKDF